MSKSENRALPAEIHVRLSVPVARALRADAEQLDLSDASMVRHILAQYFPDVDPMEVEPSKRRRRQKPSPSLELREISALRESLAEMGGTLRQVAGLSRRAGQTASHQAIEEMLPLIKHHLAVLDDLKKVMA